jgi:hypothetical protein
VNSPSPRALNRATLARQLLLRREGLGIIEGLRRSMALQAQHSASTYLALWNRLEGFAPEELDAAFAGYRVVKSNLMRVTLHAVLAEDYPAYREAMEPTLRGARLGDRRFTDSGLTAKAAEELIPDIVAFADVARTNGDFEAWLERRMDGPKPGAWWDSGSTLRFCAHQMAAPGRLARRRRDVASPSVAVPVSQEASAESLKTLVLRYLEGFGPASVADIAQFAMVQRSRVKKALQA